MAKKCLWKSQHSSEQSLALLFWMFKPAKVYLFLVCSSKMLKPLFFWEPDEPKQKKDDWMIGLDSCHAVMQVMCSSVLCLILATVLEKLGLPEPAGEAGTSASKGCLVKQKHRLHGEALPFPSQQVTVRGRHLVSLGSWYVMMAIFRWRHIQRVEHGSLAFGQSGEDGWRWWRWLDSAFMKWCATWKTLRSFPPAPKKHWFWWI